MNLLLVPQLGGDGRCWWSWTESKSQASSSTERSPLWSWSARSKSAVMYLSAAWAAGSTDRTHVARASSRDFAVAVRVDLLEDVVPVVAAGDVGPPRGAVSLFSTARVNRGRLDHLRLFHQLLVAMTIMRPVAVPTSHVRHVLRDVLRGRAAVLG